MRNGTFPTCILRRGAREDGSYVFLYLELWGYDGSPEMNMMYLLENGGAPARQV